MHEDDYSKVIVDSALQVHRVLGPGLLESVYEVALAYELESRDLDIVRQVPMPVVYRGVRIDQGYVADLIVGNKVIIELKSVMEVIPIHKKQLLTYLRLANMRLGLLINFNVPLIRDGLHRVVNGLQEKDHNR